MHIRGYRGFRDYTPSTLKQAIVNAFTAAGYPITATTVRNPVASDTCNGFNGWVFGGSFGSIGILQFSSAADVQVCLAGAVAPGDEVVGQ
jgi:hypothetical protein